MISKKHKDCELCASQVNVVGVAGTSLCEACRKALRKMTTQKFLKALKK